MAKLHAQTKSKNPSRMERLREQIPSMTTAELTTLRDNAERLSKAEADASEERQKEITTAWEVIALVDGELGTRKPAARSSLAR